MIPRAPGQQDADDGGPLSRLHHIWGFGSPDVSHLEFKQQSYGLNQQKLEI